VHEPQGVCLKVCVCVCDLRLMLRGEQAAGLGALFPVQGAEAAGKAGPRLPQSEWNALVASSKLSKQV